MTVLSVPNTIMPVLVNTYVLALDAKVGPQFWVADPTVSYGVVPFVNAGPIAAFPFKQSLTQIKVKALACAGVTVERFR